MTWPTEERRRNWLPLLLTFLLGLFIGWWVIGWWLWPVTYTNSLPQDLRADEKGQYLGMVADAYAATGDLATAERRTAAWPRDELARDLDTLQVRLSQENPGQAENVRRLATALNVAPEPAAPAAVATVPPPASPRPNILTQVCPGALGVLVALVGLAALVWLWRQWQRRSALPPPDQPAPLPDDLWGRTSAEEIARQEQARWTEVGGEAEEPETEDVVPPAPVSYTPPPATGAVTTGGNAGRSVLEATSVPEPVDAQQEAVTPEAEIAPEGRPVRLAEFMATYHAGEPDYDEAFDIKDQDGAVIGQCGLSLMMPLGRGGDKAAALQVWLWEERDQYTQVKVLMSESAYRNTGMRDQLAEDNPAIPVREGTEFDLMTHNLVLLGTVERLAYEEGEGNRIFSHLAVRLTVFAKG